MADRPSTCTSCGKRLSRKQWYYRTGQYFCNKRCWATHIKKAHEGKEGKPQAPAEPAPAVPPQQAGSGASPKEA